MEKLCATLMLCSMALLAMPSVHGHDHGSMAVETWFKHLPKMDQKVTKLHFYLHDVVSGSSPSAMRVAQSNITSTSPTAFGFVAMADDKLTIGPSPNSTVIGQAQGLYGSASLDEVALIMVMNFVFTKGRYNGSTLSLLGRNPVFLQPREMSIVDGTGVFRMARGTAIARTHDFNLTTGDAIVEYHVMVVHY